MPDTAPSRLFVGCMTGTSLDGLDVAIVEITGTGLDISPRLIDFVDRPLGEIGARLRTLADQTPMKAADIARLALEFGELHAGVIQSLLAGRRAELITVHGQTVFHAPPASWQMINPWPIVERTRCPVVCDLRGADLAAGGQGAPITPLADWTLFRGATSRAIINLGGFCNITLLPASTGSIELIRGMDVCACNHILDRVAQRALGKPFDEGGAAAMRGVPSTGASLELTELLQRQSALGRSLGTGDEAARWVDDRSRTLQPNDLAATAVEGLARAIAGTIPEDSEPIVAGGGARNRALIKHLGAHLVREVRTTADLGVPIHAREAVGMAVLGALASDGVPITLPRVTGRRESTPRSGLWIHP
ncbi:MAG: anhydro-N-acetylmuramic acid kinase [Phycisphaerae bacterium]|nr:anhydro-N-acetylmuramic acid kinase [Phycisphaerae bacterium]